MEYTVKRSSRRTVSLEITADCGVLVRAPLLMSDRQAEEFVQKHTDWIEKKLAVQRKRRSRSELENSRELELREKARRVLPEMVERYSSLMKLYPSSVKITSATTRFGSCSGKNAICFSWRLMAYPDNAVEYVVVHELAHIKHHNHGKGFYRLIEKYLPDYKERKKMLRTE